MDGNKVVGGSNAEDRRAGAVRRNVMIGGGVAIGGIVVALVLSLATGQNPLKLLGLMGGPKVYNGSADLPQNDEDAKFVSKILANTESFWVGKLKSENLAYTYPKTALYTKTTSTTCGLGESASGPFYCPTDSTIYLDLNFFQELSKTDQVPGRFAQAYVLAHEVGHHIQNLMGTSSKIQLQRSKLDEVKSNALWVRLELQADCYSGIWANSVTKDPSYNLNRADLESGLKAARGVGDEILQNKVSGMVIPDSFTHGSSYLRSQWFSRGFETGSIKECDTFNGKMFSM
jgi:uncharacterized protein